MFYAIENENIRAVDIGDIGPDTIHVGCLTLDELRNNCRRLDIDEALIAEFDSDSAYFRMGIEVYDTFSFGRINVINLEDVMKERDRFAFIIKKNQFLIIKIKDADDSTMAALESAVGRFKINASLEKVVFGILERLLAGGNKTLEEGERHIMELEKNVAIGDISYELNSEIYNMRNRLSIMRNFYEQLVDIGEALQENENGLFPEGGLRYFKIFTDKASRLSMNTQTLSESLIHLREALDATLDYNMNRIMKVFTVVSVIFMPLTLIVGWYGMNFTNMPEITWKYGYLFAASLCVAVAIACLVYFKKKKLL